MSTSVALLILSMAACAWLAVRGIREHRDAMASRHRLLDEAVSLLSDASIMIGPDQFPVATGRIADGRQVKIELIGDSMITRRLPQLWLRVTIYDSGTYRRPLIGALARPTGGEYYSLVHDMREWMAPPKTGTSMLMRGDGTATPWQTARVLGHFSGLFADPQVKEAVISPNGVRIMRQAAQGERAAHLFLRQSRFAIASVPAEDINTAIAMASALAEVLPESVLAPVTEAA
ncbi:hypothetical protein [Rhizobium sp. LjRoot254]|uniref:hypothetical protein n=1 Tax=Rhizobium sp. LjRoot254 TaxID=3342297 RepID=UPI003ECF36F0